MSDCSRIIYGCMGLGGAWDKNAIDADDAATAHAAIDAALEAGITRFDHADIYSQGKAEQVFGQVLKERPELRSQIELQSKCGIRMADGQAPKRYDLSKQWILESVDGILHRLDLECIDILLLHRPDHLMQTTEIADAFDQLLSNGKVAKFGVSNMHHYQIDALQQTLPMSLVANQLEISLKQHAWLDEATAAGHPAAKDAVYSPATIDYCRQHGVEIQSWGSLCQGVYSGLGSNKVEVQTTELARQLAEKYRSTVEAILLGWLMRHPAKISPVIGTTNPARIKACAQPLEDELSREDWYALYQSARGEPIP